MESKGTDDQHDDTTDGVGGESAVPPTDTQIEIRDEYDPLQPFQEEEGRILEPESMLVVPSLDTQCEEEDDSEGDDDQSGKQKQKCPENIGSGSELVDSGESSSQVQRLVLSPSSKSQGVTYNKSNKHWEAHIWIKEIVLRGREKKGVQIFAGNYETEDEAKQAHDRLAMKFDIRETLRGKPYSLNFPESDFLAEHRDWSLRDFVWLVRRSACKFNRGSCDLKGVTVRTHRRGTTGEEAPALVHRYASRIAKGTGQDKQTATIGTYDSVEEAGKAYDRALLFINKDKEEVELWHVITNFRPSVYTEAEILEAGSKLVFRTMRGNRRA